tara:strand:+ start:440 stop:1072 length:633 start_codon:yes stop_codon:yes gene_type:complete
MADLLSVLGGLGESTIAFLPNLISAVILLIIGLVVGKILGRVVKELLERVNLDYFVTEQKKPVVSLSNLFSVITRWWIYLGFITAALSNEILGIPALAAWTAQITAFIPKIIGASAIIVAGYALGEYIKMHLKSTNKLWAMITGKVIFFFTLYVGIALALPVLGIPATLVNNILLIIVGALGLGIAIALGLGLKNAVDTVAKKYVNKVKI